MLFSDVTKAVGRTPLIKLNRVASQLECNLYAKCEFFNPGGSVKDRIAFNMVEAAEKSGRIKPGDTLIEPTSGNTGIGIALAGAVKGYKVVITMPEKMSREKQVVLEALGARIIRTPTEAAWDAPESHIGIAKKLQKELPNAHILDQYSNPENPNAHYLFTGSEIAESLGNKVDMVVIAAGTGGTITGIAKKLKEVNPKCIVVGADPVGSLLADDNHEVGTYKVEGIGYDFVPEVLDRKMVDRWVKTHDRQSFLLARRLIKEEGLLCGGSSGAALSAALFAAKELKKGQNCVVLLADGIRNYMSKFVDDKWMFENRFTTIDALSGKVKDLLGSQPPKVVAVNSKDTAEKAINTMRSLGFSQLPVLEDGQVVGIINENIVLEYLLSGAQAKDSPIAMVMDRKTANCVTLDTPLSTLQDLLLNSGSAIVVDSGGHPLHMLTRIDLVNWISNLKGS
jgi:cystathionine beta-synthase